MGSFLFGIMGLVMILDKKKTRYHGLPWVFTGLASFVSLMAMPIIQHEVVGREEGAVATCMSNQRQIMAEIQMYAQDHHALTPTSATVWHDVGVDSGVVVCPDQRKIPNGYGYNEQIAGHALGEFADPEKVIVTADRKAENPHPGLLLTTDDIDPRHHHLAVVSFLDGHVSREQEKPAMLSVRWQMPVMHPEKAHPHQ